MYFFLFITIAWPVWFVWEHHEAYGEIGEEKIKHICIIQENLVQKTRLQDEFDLKRMMGNPNCVFDDLLCAMKSTYLQPPDNEYFL